MMTTSTTTAGGRYTSPARRSFLAKQRGWARSHWRSLIIVGFLLTIVGLAQGLSLNGSGYPSDDEGTYMAQAWAMIENGDIAHYTYWYDHPFLGWALLTPFLWLAELMGRDVNTVTIGREAMVVFNLISCGLVYMFARRIKLNRAFATLAVVLFALSPLAMHFHRMVFLDNISTMFILAALVYAASPRRSLAAAFGAGICAAAAAWTKETSVILLVAVVYVLVQHTTSRIRAWSLGIFWSTFVTVGSFYILYAALNNELLPGPGHVSLYDAVMWQLFERDSDGSILDKTSATYGMAMSWVNMDPWLLLTGVALMVPVVLVTMACLVRPFRKTQLVTTTRRLRPITTALLIQVIMMFRDGYMPYPYVTAMIPFAALLIAGSADSLWQIKIGKPVLSNHYVRRLPRLAVRYAMVLMALAGVTTLAFAATPSWADSVQVQTTTDQTRPWKQATEWVIANVPKDAVIVTDDLIWPDLTRHGFTNPVWNFKVDLDPEVKEEIFPNGWRDVDYVVLGPLTESAKGDMPTVVEAMEHSQHVITFGDETLIVYKVDK